MLNNKAVSRLVEAEKDARVINAAFDLEKGKCSFALAVVTETWGSSPRQAGSMMLVEKGGHVVGSVSGGCVEGEVVTSAKEVMDLEKFQVLNFGITDDDAWKAGLSCGGKMTVFVCPNNFVQKGLFGKIKESDNGGENITIECNLKNGLIRQVNELSEDLNDTKEIMDNFRITLIPKPRVFIIGAVQISQHLVPMAKESGFEVVVIDPRSQFANQKRFPDTCLHVEWPDEVLEKENLSVNDSIVTLTHDPKIDDAALEIALKLPLFCISCLGSKRTNTKRRERLMKKGFSGTELKRLNAPAGIDIGSKTPAEIAVSILAQLIKSRRSLEH